MYYSIFKKKDIFEVLVSMGILNSERTDNGASWLWDFYLAGAFRSQSKTFCTHLQTHI